MQRLLDILFAGGALLVLSPLLLIVMLVLRLTGEGEVFFKQTRIGRGGEAFGVYKFATMMKNSPSLGTGTVTVKDDPRVLPVGRVLRRTKINELPQLLNIAVGDMSIVGPRPQTPRCFEAFPESSQREIIKVRPGLSGIGSIVFRDEEQIMDASTSPEHLYDNVIMPYKGKLEEWFVTKQSTSLYFKLIALTAWAVLFPRSMAVWRSFSDLPKPEPGLKALLGLD